MGLQVGVALIDSVLMAGTTFYMTVINSVRFYAIAEGISEPSSWTNIWKDDLLPPPVLHVAHVCNLSEWWNLVVES